MSSTSAESDDNNIPQWKKDLIARLRNQNKRTATAVERQQLCGGPPRSVEAVGRASAVQQPGAGESVAVLRREQCASSPNSNSAPIMVQDRPWTYPVGGAEKSDSDSSEDLHYGPGIVSRLKNKYLSLALRESTRASILPMRKAASLENILDDIPNVTSAGDRLFHQQNGICDNNKHAKNRYRAATRGASDMKRARSVETISRSGDHHHSDLIAAKKRESLHEEALITYGGSDHPPGKTTNDNNMVEAAPDTKPFSIRTNRPKRIAPLMNDKEKPPADFVKQTKRIFERRPEERTKPPQHTGEVAAKIATYTTIIGQTRVVTKKPPIKVPKPVMMRHPIARGKPLKPCTAESNEKTNEADKRAHQKTLITSPIPDISMIELLGDNELNKHQTSLSETPDLIMTSSPITVSSPTYRITATEDFIKEEVLHSSKIENGSMEPNKGAKEEYTPPQTVTFNFTQNPPNNNHRPPALQPLKIEINGSNGDCADGVKSPAKAPKSPAKLPSPITAPPPPPPMAAVQKSESRPTLTSVEIKKNFINAVKTREIPSNESTTTAITTTTTTTIDKVKKDITVQVNNVVPKLKIVSHEPINSSSSPTMRFNFTDRKEIPNYVHNDGTIRVQPVQKPKPGEGGIIIIPGASLDESVTDEEDELMRSLEAPPSPCDVTFINDNVLIDGKSSISQKSKKAKMRISFVDSHPEIYEYPSESSLLIDESPSSPTAAKSAQMGHAVPSLSGSSSLANYTPKGTVTTDDFQPGVTRKIDNKSDDESPTTNGVVLEEVEEPILFSSGTNSDMLF